YVYRGPIQELQGLYFFGDGNVAPTAGRVWALRYNNTTPFSGVNFTDFAKWYDPATPNSGLLIPDVGTIDTVSSFGQDLQGNLFIVVRSGGVGGGRGSQVAGGGALGMGQARLTIPAGQTSFTISVPITGDRLDEPNETFQVVLSNPSGDVLGTDTGTGTII